MTSRRRGRSPRWTRRAAVAGVAVTLLGVLAACGLPDGGQAVRVAPEEVPYSLLATPSASPTSAAPTTPGIPTTTATIYLVNTEQRLVPSQVTVSEAATAPLVQSLLNRLAVGPSERERGRGLVTDLGPGASITLRALKSGVAVIELRTGLQDPTPAKLPIAVGQVVLTATSVVGIDAVTFVADGVPVGVPGPPLGETTNAPLRSADYGVFLAPGVTAPARTAPLSRSVKLQTGPTVTLSPSS